MKIKVFNYYSELHFSEGTFYKIHTLTDFCPNIYTVPVADKLIRSRYATSIHSAQDFSGIFCLIGSSLVKISSQAFFTAIPFRSVPVLAAVGEVFGTYFYDLQVT